MIPRRSLSAALRACTLLAGLGLATPAARADVIHVSGSTGAYGYDVVTLHYSAGLLGNGTHEERVYSGADRLTATNLTTGAPFSPLVFCTDIAHNLTTPSTYTTGLLSDSVSDPVKLAQIGALIGYGTAALASGQTGGYTATELSSALQIAVWTAEYQTGTSAYSVTDPTRGFWISGASDANDVSLANWILAQVVAQPASGAFVIRQLETQHGSQQLSYADVPEPASLATFGIGALGLALVRRRRAQVAPATPA